MMPMGLKNIAVVVGPFQFLRKNWDESYMLLLDGSIQIYKAPLVGANVDLESLY